MQASRAEVIVLHEALLISVGHPQASRFPGSHTNCVSDQLAINAGVFSIPSGSVTHQNDLVKCIKMTVLLQRIQVKTSQ